jgi:hypothetical protein
MIRFSIYLRIDSFKIQRPDLSIHDSDETANLRGVP